MLQKLSFWFIGGLTAGLAVSLPIWLILLPALNMFVNNNANVEQTLTTSIVEASINNPDVQKSLKNQILLYLKSSEGKTMMAEILKSPEMVSAMSENIQSPEVKNAIVKLMQNPEFSQSILQCIKDSPEGKVLTYLTMIINLDNQQSSPDER